MIRETFPVGLLRCNCTILGDAVSREAIVVDPGADLPIILHALAKHSLRVSKIFITHAHIDHIAGAVELKRITGAPIMYHEADLALVAMMDQQAEWLQVATPVVVPPDHSPSDEEGLFLGDTQMQVVHTPGHTQGSLCLHLPANKLLIAGDTLFAGSVGRTDLPGGNPRQLIRSIRERVMPLPADTVVIPGHGPETTIAHEARSNPFLFD